MYTEQQLIARILQGNLHAFKHLVHQHEKLVRHMVNRLVHNEADAEDICQEAFIKVYRHLASFKNESKLSTWIARIAYSTAINHLRKSRPDVISSDAFEQQDHLYKTTETPEHILNKKDTAAIIHQEIAKLPVNYRTVLTLYHLNEFSYEEIEHITGMPEGTVKSYLFRARKLLKDKLKNLLV